MRVRYGEYTHDPLTVNCVMFEQDGVRVALISCDLAFLPDDFVKSAQTSCEKEVGIPASSVLIACTHSHLAPCTTDFIFGSPDEKFMAALHRALVDVVLRSSTDLEDADIYAGSGWLEQMGFNRRGLHHGGKGDMYYGSWREGFEGVEGPRDGEVGVVFARKPTGDIKAVVTSFSTHPNSVEGESYFSADLVGAVRSFLRHNLGEGVGVVYLTGAAGNTAPSKLDDNEQGEFPWRDEEGWKRSGQYLGSEILKTIAGTIKPMPDPVLKLSQATVDIPIKPWPESFDPSKLEASGMKDYYMQSSKDWPQILQNESPVKVNVNVLRIGDAAICTNPAEFFVEFGLMIKENSPATVTLISELTDGYAGYVPTELAFEHGGYCTLPARTSKLDKCAGGIIVDTTRRLFGEVF